MAGILLHSCGWMVRPIKGCWFRGVPERLVAGGACPEPVEGTPEDARKDGHIRGRSKSFMKYPG
jgi:hypothetical protein